MAGVTEQSPGEDDTNMSPAATSRVLHGHWYEELVQTQKRGQRRMANPALVALMCQIRVDVSTTHIEGGVSNDIAGESVTFGLESVTFSSALGTAQAPDQVPCKAPG